MKPKIILERAAAESPFGRQYKNKAIAVDQHGCYLFLLKNTLKRGQEKWSLLYNPEFVEIINDERKYYPDFQ